MASNQIVLKRSLTSGKVPTTADLVAGELAFNVFDGKLYGKKDNGTASIVEFVTTAHTIPWSSISAKPFDYTAQPAQPTYVWGTNDGTTYQVWNPSNFSVSSATNSTTSTYLSSTPQINPITGAAVSMAMLFGDMSSSRGSFTCRSTGTGEANLAGITFWNDIYAIQMGVRSDGYFGLGGLSRPAWSFYSAPDGSIVAAGNVTAYSDPRLKENFERVKNPLAIIEQLDGGTFNWKTGIAHIECKAGKRDFGVLADQVEAVMPEIVTDSIAIDGQSYKTVSYEKLVPVLIEAIKELHARIQVLEAKNTTQV